MANIYSGQDLRLQLTLGVGTTSATVIFKYRTPSGTTGSWTASETTASTGVYYYDLKPASTLTVGDWIVWGHVTFSDSKIGMGIPATFVVRTEGSI